MNEQPKTEFLIGVTNIDASVWNWWKIKGDEAEISVDKDAGCQRVSVYVGEKPDQKCVCDMRGPNVAFMEVPNVVPPSGAETAARRDRH
jgi:hypothetical protein